MRRHVPKSARGPTRSVSSPLQGAGLPMEWAKMEADNARHDGTQDHGAAVGSGSSPRRTEVWYRASSRSNAQRRSRCQRAQNSAASQGISPQFVQPSRGEIGGRTLRPRAAVLIALVMGCARCRPPPPGADRPARRHPPEWPSLVSPDDSEPGSHRQSSRRVLLSFGGCSAFRAAGEDL